MFHELSAKFRLPRSARNIKSGMAPVDRTGKPTGKGPHNRRVILYHQTHYTPAGEFVAALPLVREKTGITHVILAALHVNEKPGDITLNDDHAITSPRASRVWAEVRELQQGGVRVLVMLGGAAKGSFTRLDANSEFGPRGFEAYYQPLRDLLRSTGIDGIDLDVEEDMSLAGIIRLIDRLREDFGPAFVITLAPVATALLGAKHLSGFNYLDLEKAMGRHIAWYNTQFYNGWGSSETTEHYDAIISCGWPPDKIVLGVLTNPSNGGSGWVFEDLLMATVAVLRDEYPKFGGVMGWEYFNALSSMADAGDGSGSDRGKPWLWAKGISTLLRSEIGPAHDDENNASAVQPSDTELQNTNNPFLQLVKNQGGR